MKVREVPRDAREGGSVKSWAGIERIGLFLIVAGFILANFYSLSPTSGGYTSSLKDQSQNEVMSSQSIAKQQSIYSSASPLPLPSPSTSTIPIQELRPAILPVKVLPSPLWSIPSTASLGNVLVIGAGRPLGSALVAALYASGVAVWATEDGTMGFISSVHYDVPVFEFNISVTVGSLDDIWRRRAPDTVFVDGDAATPVAPWGAPLACVLSMPRFNLAQKTKRIVFLGDSAGSKQWGNDYSGLQEIGLSGLCAKYVDSSKEQMDKLEYPSVGLVTWPGKIILGPSIDPTRPGAHTFGSPLNSFLLCLVRHAENVPISSHEFDLGKVLTFFASSLDSSSTTGCANLLSSAISEALNSAIDPSLASADAVAAALELSTASNEYLSSLHLFSSSLSSSSGEIVGVQESLGSQLLAATSWPLPAAHFINGLPRPSSNSALANPSVDSFKVQVASAVTLAHSSSSSSPSSSVVLPSVALALSDTFWWVWRHAVLRGYRYPEPLPDYDPEVRVGKKDKYSIHDIGTFGVSHETGHIKMRHCASIWGWRFKRGGLPWSSTATDALVPVKVISPPEGSPYHLLALRTVAIWIWALEVYPGYAWYTRMWDDVIPIVERYVDIASAHDGDGKLAVGRVIGARSQYLSGGPPGLFSRGWGNIMRRGAPVCLDIFRRFAQTGGGILNQPLPGRGRETHNARIRAGTVETHCNLGCEDLVIEQCLRDTIGEYYELVHWWGFDSLAPSTINEKGLYECKAFACRRRIIARGDEWDTNPIQSVTYHYVKPKEMLRAEEELYGGPPPGSPQWTDMCEQAQARQDCIQELIPMPLPEPGLRPGWNIAKSSEGEEYYYNSGTGQVHWVKY
jgi:hypothetical protein